jgi:isoleucyl-tRNA synthetase
MENNDFIILNTTLTDDLIKEGIAREFISKVQNMRKTNDFNIIDRISVSYMGDELVKEAIQDYHEFISSEILATSLKEDTIDGEFFDLNGHETKIVIEKNK